jgi:hypothetical protein
VRLLISTDSYIDVADLKWREPEIKDDLETKKVLRMMFMLVECFKAKILIATIRTSCTKFQISPHFLQRDAMTLT